MRSGGVCVMLYYFLLIRIFQLRRLHVCAAKQTKDRSRGGKFTARGAFDAVLRAFFMELAF